MLTTKDRQPASKNGGQEPAAALRVRGVSLQPGALWTQMAMRAQAKLDVSVADDPAEREADRVAERVLRTPQAGPRGTCAACSSGTTRCAKCDEGRTLQRKARVGAGPAVPSEGATLGLAGGRPLEPEVRGFFEPRFGFDFGRVRIHTDARADEYARRLAAQAFTLGSDVVFRAAHYAPGSEQGRTLLAHELTHVVQQHDGRAPARRVHRAARTLPTRSGGSNFLLYPIRGNVRVRATTFSSGLGFSGDVSAIAGEGMTLRGLARMLLPFYDLAATPAGAPAAPTEEELAKAVLQGNRAVLGPPAMSDFRAGLRLVLPIELDRNPGPVSRLRDDWLVDADNVRAQATQVTAAEAPAIDQPAAAPAAAPTASSVAAFTAAVTGAEAQGLELHRLVMTNPFRNAPLATQVLAGMPAADRFDAAMGFMTLAVNPEVSLLETLAPGFALLQLLRSTLTAAPVGLAAPRDSARLRHVGMLPEDPVIAGLAPDYLTDTGPGAGVDRPDVIYFRRGRTSIDESEWAKIGPLAAAHAATPLTLVGFASEEESATLATARTHAVERQLRVGSAIVDTETVGVTASGQRPSIGSMSYAEMRSVRITTAAPGPELDCSAPGVATAEACTPNHAPVETAFTAAQGRALTIVDQARNRMSGADAGRDVAIARRFGVASHALLRTRLDMLHGTIKKSLTSHQCGTLCDAACSSGAIAYSSGPGRTPLMVVCDAVLSNDSEYAASVVIHESCHATSGMLQAAAAPGRRGPADWAYRWERMGGTIAEMSPNRSLDNADSYTQFVMDLRDPTQIPAGSQPIEEAPKDDFVGTWTATTRNAVRHGLANCQKWLGWASQYVSVAYEAAVRGRAHPIYTRIAARFGGFAATPGDSERAKLAGIEAGYENLERLMSMAMRIEHAPSGAATSFGAAGPLLLLVGTDFSALGNDRSRGEFLVRKLVEAATTIDAAQRTAYAELVPEIRRQYEADRS